VINQRQRATLQRAINKLVRAERWLADEESESQRRGQTQYLNHARLNKQKADTSLQRALDKVTVWEAPQ
jgi:predicted transcriptional regulator